MRTRAVLPLIALLLFGACSGGRSLRGSGGAPAGSGGVGGVGSGGVGSGGVGSGGVGSGGSAGATGGSTAGTGGAPGGAGGTPVGTGGGTSGGPGGSGGVGGGGNGRVGGAGGAGGVTVDMTFFVTSRGSGNWGNLGGLAGADALCTSLATAVSPVLGAKTWRAYLSTSTVNARDRIGPGPWRNARGRTIALNLTQLHDQAVGGTLDATWPVSDADVALDERGARVPTEGMGSPRLRNEVFTGSNVDGSAGTTHCNNWTSSGTGGAGIANGDDVRLGQALIGHSDRAIAGLNRSWNSAGTISCGAQPTPPFGYRGAFYCFALP